MSDNQTLSGGTDAGGFWRRIFMRNLPAEQRALLGTLSFFAIIVIVGWVGVNEPRRMAEFDSQYQARSIQRGAVLFDSNCKSCHGANGQGIEGVAPAINTPAMFNGERLAELAYPGTVQDYIELTIAAGRPARSANWPNPMPTWSQDYGGPLRPDQVRDLTRFVMNWGCAYDPECAPPDEAIIAEATPPPTEEAPAYEPVGVDVTAPLPEGDAARGEQLFLGAAPGPDGKALGCQACHSLDGSVLVGPSMQGVSGRIPDGYESPEAYLHESIVAPAAYTVPGFEGVVMPANFGERLDAQSLADIIAYLLSQ